LTVVNEPHGAIPDHGLALFCGLPSWYQLMGYQSFFEDADETQRSAVSGVLAPNFSGAPEWQQIFEYTATRVTHSFAGRIRGYRKARRASIVRQFFRIPGRLHLSDRELVISLEPSAVHVAVHISGEDDTVLDPRWLDGRSIRFILEGL
jgi:hypothetical protein